MTESGSTLENLDFEQMYRTITGDGGAMPWDIGEPQPALIEVDDAGEISGEVVDIGCGLGDNAIFLAGRGHRVTGVDGAPSALAIARERAAERGHAVEFVVADATSLDGFEGRFDTAVDSALYHCLNEDDRRAYLSALHRACKPGARLHLFCFSEDVPEAFPAPFRISERNLRDTVGEKWEITRLEPARYTASLRIDDVVAAMPDVLPDVGGAHDAAAQLEQDEHGRALVPMWRLTARRS